MSIGVHGEKATVRLAERGPIDSNRPTLRSEIARLDNVLDAHEKAVESLAKVLEPVMLSTTIGGEPLREPEPPLCDVVRAMREVADRVSAATRNLEQINAALAI